jgi:hypothetical protein
VHAAALGARNDRKAESVGSFKATGTACLLCAHERVRETQLPSLLRTNKRHRTLRLNRKRPPTGAGS